MIAISEKIRQVSIGTIADVIREKKCILFLGPNLFMSDTFPNRTRQNVFFENLQKQNTENILAFFPNDDLLLFKDPSDIWDSWQNMKEHFSSNFESELIQRILEIPFHFIVNLSLYSNLQETAGELNFNFIPETFNKLTKNELSFDPTEADSPMLLYNFLGSTKETSSVVLSHDDLFTYIKSILDQKRIPTMFIDLLQSQMKTSVLLFLGVDFTKWYTQLMLSILDIPEKKITRYASGQNMLHEQFELCKNGLNIKFVTDNIPEFVNNLHGAFKAKNELRKPLNTNLSQKPIIIKFRGLLETTFQGSDGASKFERFCDDYKYDEVSTNFCSDQDKSYRIDLLLKYVKHKKLYNKLLDDITNYNKVHIDNIKDYFEA